MGKAEDVASDDTELELEEPEKVETGDSLKVRQVMDEAVVQAVLEMDYEEDFFWGNIKLIIMACACGFTALAQFYPGTFPESRFVLGVCCVAYFGSSILLQLIISFAEKDVILSTRPNEAKGHDRGISISTSFPRFQEEYTTYISWKGDQVGSHDPDDKKGDKGAAEGETHFTIKVGDFFDIDGYFDAVGVIEATKEALQRHEKTATVSSVSSKKKINKKKSS